MERTSFHRVWATVDFAWPSLSVSDSSESLSASDEESEKPCAMSEGVTSDMVFFIARLLLMNSIFFSSSRFFGGFLGEVEEFILMIPLSSTTVSSSDPKEILYMFLILEEEGEEVPSAASASVTSENSEMSSEISGAPARAWLNHSRVSSSISASFLPSVV